MKVDVAIIGGGVFGTSIAWHLARAGLNDVLIIERNAVGSGASARAAGLVSMARDDPRIRAMVRATLDDMRTLDETGDGPVGLSTCGSLRVAWRPELASGVERTAHQVSGEGVRIRALSKEQAGVLAPWLDSAGAATRIFYPDDGHVDGHGLAMAYSRAARGAGVKLWSQTAAVAPVRDGTRVIGVDTSRGRVHCRWLIDAAGAWAGQVLGWYGVNLPAAVLRSHYWITQPLSPPTADQPIVVLPDARAYLHPEGGALLLGIQERRSRVFDDRELASDMGDMVLTDATDWDLLDAHMPVLRGAIPALENLGIKHHVAGLTTYTPDGRFVIGAVAQVPGLLVASGCCGTGVSVCGGVGRLVRDLVLGRASPGDIERFRADRFQGLSARSAEFVARCVAARAEKSRGPHGVAGTPPAADLPALDRPDR